MLSLKNQGVIEIYNAFKVMSERGGLPVFYTDIVQPSLREYAALAEFLRQGGFPCAFVQILNDIVAIEVHDGHDFWLLSPSDGILFKGAPALRLGNDKERVFRASKGSAVTYRLPVTVSEFSLSFQVVGHIIRCGTNDAIPFLGQSPSLRKRQYLDLLADGEDQDTMVPALDFWFLRPGRQADQEKNRFED